VQLKLVRKAAEEAAQQRSQEAHLPNASHTPQPLQGAQKELQEALDACNSARAISTASQLFRPAQEASDQCTSQTGTYRPQPLPSGASQQTYSQSRSADNSTVDTGNNADHAVQDADHWLVGAGYAPLGQRCGLFARKFPAGEQEAVLVMALSCRGLGLGSWCAASR
jgi:hypothetical protein